MTAAIITDSGNTIVVQSSSSTTVVSGIVGPPGVTRLTNAQDVDISALGTGSLLVYNPNTLKWVATNELTQQIIDGGQF